MLYSFSVLELYSVFMEVQGNVLEVFVFKEVRGKLSGPDKLFYRQGDCIS